MSTWLLQAGGAPATEDQSFDAAPTEGAWVLNDSWQYGWTFAAGVAEASWAVDWTLHDSALPLIGWAAGAPPPAGGASLLMLMGVG